MEVFVSDASNKNWPPSVDSVDSKWSAGLSDIHFTNPSYGLAKVNSVPSTPQVSSGPSTPEFDGVAPSELHFQQLSIKPSLARAQVASAPSTPQFLPVASPGLAVVTDGQPYFEENYLQILDLPQPLLPFPYYVQPTAKRELLQVEGQLWLVSRYKNTNKKQSGNVEFYCLVEQSENGTRLPARSVRDVGFNEHNQRLLACWPTNGVPSPKGASALSAFEANALLEWLDERYRPD